MNKSVSDELATQIEYAELYAFADMYRALPVSFAQKFGLKMQELGGVVVLMSTGIPFIHFNCVLGLGIGQPATESLLDHILAIYNQAGINNPAFFHVPRCQPEQFASWLEARGLLARGGWERIYRGNEPLTTFVPPLPDGSVVEKVTGKTAESWANYLDAIYGMPTKPWLLATVGRAGYHHYMLKCGDKIKAVRSMVINPDGIAWWGIDAPVPGIMAPSFDLDLQLCQVMVQDGLQLGAKLFVADIEAPSPKKDTPAYTNFAQIGFKIPYFRTIYS